MKTLLRSKVVIATAVVTTLGAITFACNDFLDIPPQGAVGEVSLANKAGVEGSLIAAYRSLDCSSSSAGSWGCAASNWVWASVPSGDAYKGSNLGDQQPINSIETFFWNVGEAEGYLNQKWSQVYEGVFRANATLRILDKVQAANPNEISAADARSIRGEALFLRAHYHFEAYRMWGHIPYYFENDSTPVAAGGYRKPNDLSLTAIVDLIIADLNQAITLLPATPRGGDKGRATSWAARAYKGRVQVYGAALTPALWDSALVTLRAVQSGGPYALQTSFDQVWTGRLAYRNGTETILAFQASVRDGEPSGWNSNWGERLNFPHEGSHFGCCGFHQPSFNLVNFFQVDAAGLPIAMTSSAWNNRDSNFVAGNLSPVDPRVDWTVGRDNVPYKDWTVHKRSWVRDASYSGPYSPKKNVHEKIADAEHNAGWQATQTNDVNIHLFRYADLLLLLAEAEIEAGGAAGLTNAANIVNQIRARAGRTAQGCGSLDTAVTSRFPTCTTNTALQPMALPLVVASATLDTLVTPWAYYKIGLYPVPFASQAAARQAVHIERRLELAMEGQHFFDLRRWGGADTVLANYKSKESARIPYLASAIAFTLPKYQFYPIPQTQIDLSVVGGVAQLVQNPSW
jgi:hypothetical protein